MERRIRLIWDFRGEGAADAASQFMYRVTSYPLKDIDAAPGIRIHSPAHQSVFMDIPQSALPDVRATLNPDRGEYI